METTINLNLLEDFSALCCIYQIQPSVFLQTVVDQISFPSYYSNPMGADRWATFCFLNFLQEEESKYQVDEEIEDRYMSQLEASINFSLTTDAGEISESFESVRSIMRQWLKAVLTQRSRYLTDTL